MLASFFDRACERLTPLDPRLPAQLVVARVDVFEPALEILWLADGLDVVRGARCREHDEGADHR